MSIQDVCDLSSLLQVDDIEKNNLHKKILSDEANIKVQEGRLQHELEEKNRVFGLRMKVADKAKTVLHSLELHSLSIVESNSSNSPKLPSTEVEEFKQDVKRYLEEAAQMKQDSVDLWGLLVHLGRSVAEQEKESLSSLKNKLEQEQRIQDQYVSMSEEKLPQFKAVEEMLKQLNQQMITLKENIETKKRQLVDENQRMGRIEAEIISMEADALKLINNSKLEKKEFDAKLVQSTGMLEKSKTEAEKLTSDIEELGRYLRENNNDDVLKESSELDSKLILTKSQRLELVEELKQEQESLVQNQSKLNNFQGEFKLLSKEMENDLLKETSLVKKSVFADATNNLQNQLQDKGGTCLVLQNEIASINSELNETSTSNIKNVELKALLISIEESELRKIEIIQKLKNQQGHEDIADDEIVRRMELIVQQKQDIQNSIININTQIKDTMLHQNKIPLLQSEIAKLEIKLSELQKVSQELVERTGVELKNLETEKLKMTQSKQREDELWIVHEIERRYNASILQKTQEHTEALQHLTNELKIEDEKFVSKANEAKEKSEQEFLENKAKYVAILNELSTMGTNSLSLQDELMLEEDNNDTVGDAVKSEIKGKSTSKSEKLPSKPSVLKNDDVPIENRSRLRLNSQSNSQTNSQKARVPKAKSQGRENVDPSSQSKKYGTHSGSQPKIKSQQSWVDSDDDDVFGVNTFKASQGPPKKK